METVNVNLDSCPSRGMANALMVACFSLVLLLMACGGNEETTPPPAPAPQAAPSVGFLSTMTAALSQGQFTLNNPWTQADLNYENITATIGYQDVVDSKPDGQVRPFTTLVQQYWAKRRQCEEDYNSFHARTEWTSPEAPGGGNVYHFTDRKCYPTHEWVNGLEESTIGDPVANQTLYRYGYYCGGGYPIHGAFTDGAPEPLDSVDYCCRLHDAQTWANRGDRSNECGMAMCLRQASALPDGVWAQLSDVEEARQHWYGNGAFGGAAFACPGNQSNDAPPPTFGP